MFIASILISTIMLKKSMQCDSSDAAAMQLYMHVQLQSYEIFLHGPPIVTDRPLKVYSYLAIYSPSLAKSVTLSYHVTSCRGGRHLSVSFILNQLNVQH